MSKHLLHVSLNRRLEIRFECLDPEHTDCATYDYEGGEWVRNPNECWVEVHALLAIENGVGAVEILERLDWGDIAGPIPVDVYNYSNDHCECIPIVSVWEDPNRVGMGRPKQRPQRRSALLLAEMVDT